MLKNLKGYTMGKGCEIPVTSSALSSEGHNQGKVQRHRKCVALKWQTP